MQHARSPPDKTAFETLNTGATGFIISSTSLRVPLTETAKRRFFPSFNLSIIVAERFTNVQTRGTRNSPPFIYYRARVTLFYPRDKV